MKIDILDEAEEDLVKGFQFYERRSKGPGRYFLDSIFSDIESLKSYAGIHPLHFGYHRLLAVPIRKYRMGTAKFPDRK
jgi:hypothetical protein